MRGGKGNALPPGYLFALGRGSIGFGRTGRRYFGHTDSKHLKKALFRNLRTVRDSIAVLWAVQLLHRHARRSGFTVRGRAVKCRV